ncbi:hypothetical protein [Actinokineospora enzanensis]|uniref:hypothetical protein n=1 Tax=Actinokineospora enzanensis TaxID=155975 RepID=UPI0003690605|nr:hypothetical protein [Actinokineospora enzanensis]
MTAFGELFPGPKLRKESAEDAGTGQEPLVSRFDLDAGVLYVERRSDEREPGSESDPE